MVCVTMASFDALASQPLRIVSFGTSWTERGGWQAPLADALQKCLARPVDISVIAKSGSTTQWALTQVDQVASAKPDIVLIEFYANDGALNRLMTVAQSRRNIETILDRIQTRSPDTRVIMMVMGPVWGLRGMIRPFFDRYIAAHRQAAEQRGIEIIDHGGAWAKLSQTEIEAAIPDGTHPTPEKAAEIMVPTLARAICHGHAPG
jgi:lysophospholipase L1-like esterase